MKKLSSLLVLICLLSVSCASKSGSTKPSVPETTENLPVVEVTPVSPIIDIPAPVPVPEVVETPKCKTPNYTSTSKLGPTFQEALDLIKLHANSDEFITYFSKRYPKFSNTSFTAIEAIRKFRAQLAQCDIVKIGFYTPVLKGSYVGNWNGVQITENSKFILSAPRRAGHLLHETSHKYGFTHDGNSVAKNDNVNSFPYAIGYAIEDYILELEKAKSRILEKSTEVATK